jgi:hypothetical protein
MHFAMAFGLKMAFLLITHQPVEVAFGPPAGAAPQNYGPGVHRLDPGTVNLPIWVGKPPQALVIPFFGWTKTVIWIPRFRPK